MAMKIAGRRQPVLGDSGARLLEMVDLLCDVIVDVSVISRDHG
jgi:hypothetical protein